MPCVLWGCAQLVLNSSIHPSLGIVPGCSYFHFRSGLFREQKMSSKLHSPQRDVSREAALSGLCIVNFWGLFPQRGGSSPGFSIHIKLWSIKQGRRCFNCRWCFKQMKSCKTAKDVFPEEKNSQETWQVPMNKSHNIFTWHVKISPLYWMPFYNNRVLSNSVESVKVWKCTTQTTLCHWSWCALGVLPS